MKPETLLRLYPRAWRERYGEEFIAHVGNRRLGVVEISDVCQAALFEWTDQSRIGGLISAAFVASAAEGVGRVLRWSSAPLDTAVTSVSVTLAIVAVGYLLYRSNEWLFERTHRLGRRAFRVGVLLAFLGGVVQVWGRGGAHPGLVHMLPVIGNTAFFWTWLLFTARRTAVKA